MHTSHAAAAGYQNIVVKSPDTDVAVLACYFSHKIPSQLYVLIGVKNRKRIIDVRSVAEHHDQAVCSALPGLHAFTGCDSVSVLAGRGKIASLKADITTFC